MKAVKDSMESLISFKDQFTSVVQVTLQNRIALGVLRVDNGGAGMFLGKECCYCIIKLAWWRSGLSHSRNGERTSDSIINPPPIPYNGDSVHILYSSTLLWDQSLSFVYFSSSPSFFSTFSRIGFLRSPGCQLTKYSCNHASL